MARATLSRVDSSGGRRAGLGAAEYAGGLGARPAADQDQIEDCAREALHPFEGGGTENPYAIQSDLQECMHNLVGIIRTEDELKRALEELAVLRERSVRVGVEGHRQFNPGWHLALDLPSMLTVSECIARAALERRESRGGHTREDYPQADPEQATFNVVVRQRGGEVTLTHQPKPPLPDELRELLEAK